MKAGAFVIVNGHECVFRKYLANGRAEIVTGGGMICEVDVERIQPEGASEGSGAIAALAGALSTLVMLGVFYGGWQLVQWWLM